MGRWQGPRAGRSLLRVQDVLRVPVLPIGHCHKWLGVWRLLIWLRLAAAHGLAHCRLCAAAHLYRGSAL